MNLTEAKAIALDVAYSATDEFRDSKFNIFSDRVLEGKNIFAFFFTQEAVEAMERKHIFCAGLALIIPKNSGEIMCSALEECEDRIGFIPFAALDERYGGSKKPLPVLKSK